MVAILKINSWWLPSATFLDGTVILLDRENTIWHQDFDHISSTSWDIDRNMLLYSGDLENPLRSPDAAFPSRTVLFIDDENICLDTKIAIVCHLEADILTELGFYMAAILKIQYGRHLFPSEMAQLYSLTLKTYTKTPKHWSYVIYRFWYGGDLENSILPPSAAFLSRTLLLIDPENICLDTKFLIVCYLEAEILIEICFYLAAILKIQYGRHKYCEKWQYCILDAAHHKLSLNVLFSKSLKRIKLYLIKFSLGT